MSAAQSALEGLVSALSAALPEAGIAVEEAVPDPAGASGPPAGEPVPAAAAATANVASVRVTPVSLTRIGRSNRAGPVLDLELRARVRVTGSAGLAAAEELLLALEREGGREIEALPAQAVPGLGFDVRMRVPVRLDVPTGPPVTEPLRLDVRPARTLAGAVLDGAGNGIPDAVVRPLDGGRPVVTDASGRFRVLVGQTESQEFVVEVRGTTRTIEVATQSAPVVIRWE